jgi:hypothetical protein
MPASDAGQALVLDRVGLDRLVETLVGGYRIIGPTVRDNANVLAALDSADQLPAGCVALTHARGPTCGLRAARPLILEPWSRATPGISSAAVSLRAKRPSVRRPSHLSWRRGLRSHGIREPMPLAR